ncbi:MAG: hypothetical protein KGS61_19130 [Verrucomicrobia bacterium]|nr:hypothetical protein [Verrucomicrobiota bacterium]
MRQFNQYLHHRLRWWETVLVIVGVLVLGGLGDLGYDWVSAAILDGRVRAAMPTVCAGIRAQRRQVEAALEAYQARFGFYPPDHVVRRQPLTVDPVRNPLVYELAGVLYNPTNKTFELEHLEPADAKYVLDFFQCTGFKNCGQRPQEIRRLLALSPLPVRQLHDDPDVFVLAYQVPWEGLAPEVVEQFQVSPWRYVASGPTNNPGRYDLWLEVRTRRQSVIVGNWKAVD